MEMTINNQHMNDSDIKPFIKIKDELSIADDGIIMKGHQIIIPESLKRRILYLAHESHQGITSTKQLMRQKVWFPAMDDAIDKLISACILCQAANNTPIPKNPIKMNSMPEDVWKQLSIDFYGPLHPSQEYILVLIDDFSRYPIINYIKSTSANSVIQKLDTVFTFYGSPLKLKSDNGPPFNSSQFRDFMIYHNIEHDLTTPLWPQENGELERFMRVINKARRIAKIVLIFLFLRNSN